MLWVSPQIQGDELKILNDCLSRLGLHSTHNLSSKFIYRVVSYHDFPEFSKNMNDSRPFITPIVLSQIIKKNLNFRQLTVPKSGLINLHLFLKRISFSGYGSEKSAIISMAEKMGAVHEQHMSKSTQILISKSYKTEHAQFALDNQIPIYSADYIYELFNSFDELQPDYFRLKLFSGLTFTSSCYDAITKERIKKYIIQNGGVFKDHLTTSVTHLIAPRSCSSSKVKNAISLNINVVDEAFFDNIKDPKDFRNIELLPTLQTNLFNGSKFFIDQNLQKNNDLFRQLKMLIELNDGVIVGKKESSSYIIAMYSSNDYLMKTRTPIWLERCVNENKILSPQSFPLYKPSKNPPGIFKYSVSISGFSKNEYLDIVASLKWLGIQFSSQFQRSMSHLILKNGTKSKKLEAARKWGKEIVGIDWLFSIAEGSNENNASKSQNNFSYSRTSPVKFQSKLQENNLSTRIDPLSKSSNQNISQQQNFLDDDDYDDDDVIMLMDMEILKDQQLKQKSESVNTASGSNEKSSMHQLSNANQAIENKNEYCPSKFVEVKSSNNYDTKLNITNKKDQRQFNNPQVNYNTPNFLSSSSSDIEEEEIKITQGQGQHDQSQLKFSSNSVSNVISSNIPVIANNAYNNTHLPNNNFQQNLNHSENLLAKQNVVSSIQVNQNKNSVNNVIKPEKSNLISKHQNNLPKPLQNCNLQCQQNNSLKSQQTNENLHQTPPFNSKFLNNSHETPPSTSKLLHKINETPPSVVYGPHSSFELNRNIPPKNSNTENKNIMENSKIKAAHKEQDFLGDEDDNIDDDPVDIITEDQKVQDDEINEVMKTIHKLRKHSKKKQADSKQQKITYDSLMSFTQILSESDDEELPVISYGDNDEPLRNLDITKNDPLLSLL